MGSLFEAYCSIGIRAVAPGGFFESSVLSWGVGEGY